MTSKILIADDEPNIIAALELLMRLNGYDVRVARNGDDALELVDSFRPDVVLLDVMMPAKNGFEVCRQIRANPAWQRVRVVMLSAKGSESDIEAGLSLGADAYVTKPFSTKALAAQVREMVEDRQ